MATMVGLEAATALVAERPVPLVLMSGGWTAEGWAATDALGGVPLVKPFTRDALVEAVERGVTEFARRSTP